MDAEKLYEWQNKTILIVEDDLSSAFYLKEVLDDTGVNLLFATDGNQAIELVREHPEIDLVLMDIQMPILNGYEATKKIKHFRPKLAVIAQTAYAFTKDKDLCYEAGCDGYIAKPIQPKELLDHVAPYMDHRP